MLTAKGLQVSLGKRVILSGLSLEARAGEITAIIGPNGSGKSTLLRSLTGDLPYQGEARLNGQEIRTMPEHVLARHRGVLPQNSTCSFPLTVREVVRLGATQRSVAGVLSERELVGRALDAVDLKGFEGRRYHDLSGGEQQRVQLARVLCQIFEPVVAGCPRWLFLDEPVSSLDIRHQLQVMDVARSYAQAGGGVVAVLHDLNLTAMYADQIIALKRGRLAAAGTPHGTLTSPVIRDLYECDLSVGTVPAGHRPFVLPHGARV
ncbi:heme ABC transporter ATP-binding protein [Roseibium litorale]|uniref:Heme ABC transporter ATP-binding protein n=1 Tax=Roseibium litorale TaxID=2803841 RepID=A0ABR9CI13_9HYPH|nr:heme ABC transporter ATP-binding protein [Roseibium litorale]MBD8889917.1 heme ABC transporter ATP-binding protein [Roseibium litorale]